MTDGRASISAGIIARYAGDAATAVDGVRALSGRRGVRIEGDDGPVRVEVHVVAEWGASLPEVGRVVQARVREYLDRMADVDLEAVDVVVDEVGPAT